LVHHQQEPFTSKTSQWPYHEPERYGSLRGHGRVFAFRQDSTEACDQVHAITTLSYRHQSFYSRTVAYSSASAMLFSSGDSPQNASSILSGEGFDEVQPGESPLVVPLHSNRLPRLRQSRPTQLNPGTIWCILSGPGMRYASSHSGTAVPTRRPSHQPPSGVNILEGAFVAAIVDLIRAKSHWRSVTRRSPAPH
jgi:hypothetical protein